MLAATRHLALSIARAEAAVRAQWRGNDSCLAAGFTRVAAGMPLLAMISTATIPHR